MAVSWVHRSEGVHGAVILGEKPSRVLASAFILPRLNEDGDDESSDIKIPAQTKEPQHTHKDRVVVSLSGAELEHILPDGTLQPSTLKTGEVVWRLGGTHVGHNIGHTNLWVIAVEPK